MELFQILFLQLLLDVTVFLFYSVYMALSVYIGFLLIVNQLYIPGTNITSFK